MKRAQVTELLELISQGDDRALAQLEALVQTQDRATQVLFIEAMEDATDDELWEQLLLTLADDDSDDDHHELAPFGRELPTTTTSMVVEEPVRRAPPGTIEKLMEGSRTERIEAAAILADAGDPDTIPLLVAQLGGDRRVADAARRALEAFGRAATPALAEALKQREDQVRWHAAKALVPLQDPRALPAQIKALDDPNYGVRWLAAEGVAGSGMMALEPLFQYLADQEKPSAWLRQGIQHVLNTMPTQTPEQKTTLRDWSNQVKRAPTGSLPVLAREILQRVRRGAF